MVKRDSPLSRSASGSDNASKTLADLFDKMAPGHGLSTGAQLAESHRHKRDEPADDIVATVATKLAGILEMIPVLLAKQARSETPQSISIDFVDEDLRFAGTYQCSRGKQFRIFAKGVFSTQPAGCSCDESSLELPCVHLAQFVDHVSSGLLGNADKSAGIVEPDSLAQIRRRLREDDFDTASTIDRFLVPDQTERWLDGLTNLNTATADSSGDTLPPINPQSSIAGRLVWNLLVAEINGDAELQIEAILQSAKKNGGGFTKGKRISTKRLHTSDSLPVDDIDQKVIRQIKIEQDADHFGYRQLKVVYTLDAIAAIGQLIGCDRVQLDGKDAEVSANGLMFGLHDGETIQMRVLASDGSHRPIKIFHDRETIVHVDSHADRIGVAVMSPTQVELHVELLHAPEFEKAKIGKVADALRPLQRQLSILLPESTDGPQRDYHADMIVLLRAREGGVVDYGIRFRDAAGDLHLPASGPRVQSIVEKGKKHQAMRQLDAERRRASTLVRELDLHADEFNRWFDTIDDLHGSLRLIASLQKISSKSNRGHQSIEVMWDRSGQAPMRVAGTVSAGNVRVEISKKRNWFGVDGVVSVGEQKVSLPDVLAGLSSEDDDAIAGDFIRLCDGHWARVEEGLRDRLVAFRNATHTDRGGLRIDATAAGEVMALSDHDIEIETTKAWQRCIDRLGQSRDYKPSVPKDLDAKLRDYQIDGYRWMSRLARWGVGGILADDMGLGKTLQTLAVLLERSAGGPALVIAPTSVGFNWVREANRFAPTLNLHLYRDTDRADFLQTVTAGDVVVCSYGLALRDAEPLSSIQWNTMVLDEAQAIKNSRAKTSQAIANISADWTVALSGTPVENHLGELWSLFHVVSPGVFGSWASFRDRYATAIERDNNADTRRLLAQRLQPFVLRRTKSDVLKELPPRTEMNLYVDLGKEERQRYEEIRREAISDIKTLAKEGDIKDARFQILAAMTRLRQIACHPVMADDHYDGPSAKLDCLVATVQNLRSEGHRVLIFSQFVKHLSIIREALTNNAVSFEYLDGGTSVDKRRDAVDRFQSGSADAFLISLKAGGTGLNLTAADYVIHMDPWWNPAVEDQATDRAHRMGQTKPVMVYRIIARGTIEQAILKMHEDKRDLAAGVIDGTAAAAKLSNDDLIAMMSSHEV